MNGRRRQAGQRAVGLAVIALLGLPLAAFADGIMLIQAGACGDLPAAR